MANPIRHISIPSITAADFASSIAAQEEVENLWMMQPTGEAAPPP